MPPLWLIALLLGGVYYVRRKVAPNSGSGSAGALPAHIDPEMPVALKHEVLRAMANENDPKSLSDFAESLSGSFPRAAYEIRTKAWVLGGRRGPLPRPVG
jgi:hypothetical protein